MKRILLIFLTWSLSLNLYAQKKSTPQDSIKVFYNELFTALKKKYLHKNTVDWKTIESETKLNLLPYSNFKQSLKEVSILFDKIGATHCIVFHQQKKYAATGKIITKDNYTTQWRKKYDSKPGFEAKVLDGKYGYILIPGMLFFDISSANIHNLAQPLYEQIANIKTKHKIDGWIIDLRLNTGGNSTPMLLSLYDFLGDNNIWGSLDVNKKQISKFKLEKGKYMDGSETISYINPHGELLDKAKVAIITGIFTGSSGEVTAMAFKGRPHTSFIGEPTYGATTGNVFWPLPFETTLALTTTYDCDRLGRYHEQIDPDIPVCKQDNFDDLLSDQNIKESIKFINNKE